MREEAIPSSLLESTPRFSQKKITFFPAYAIFKNEEAAFIGIDHLRKVKMFRWESVNTLELEQLKRYYEPKGYTPDG